MAHSSNVMAGNRTFDSPEVTQFPKVLGSDESPLMVAESWTMKLIHLSPEINCGHFLPFLIDTQNLFREMAKIGTIGLAARWFKAEFELALRHYGIFDDLCQWLNEELLHCYGSMLDARHAAKKTKRIG